MTAMPTKVSKDETVLGIGAPTEHDRTIEAISFWHGMVHALRNTVNVPAYDVALQYQQAYIQGERLRGSREQHRERSTRGNSKHLYT